MIINKNLEQIQDEWLKSYFKNVSAVWAEWRWGRDNPGWNRMSMRERDETLAWYRQKLWELREAKRKSLVLQTRPEPKSEDSWIEDIRL